jgi:Tfp pilus assembly protein PilZ
MTAQNCPQLHILLEYASHDDFLAMLDKYAHVDTLFIPSEKDWVIADEVQIDIYAEGISEVIHLSGIIAWRYPAANVPKGRLAGIGIQLNPTDDSIWQSYLKQRVPSILATFPGNNIPGPPISERDIELWEQRDQMRVQNVSDQPKDYFEAGCTKHDYSWEHSGGPEPKTSRFPNDQGHSIPSPDKEQAAILGPPPQPDSSESGTVGARGVAAENRAVNAKRRLPNPHRWPPSKPPEKVSTDTFSLAQVKEATDLIPTKSYTSNPGSKDKAESIDSES